MFNNRNSQDNQAIFVTFTTFLLKDHTDLIWDLEKRKQMTYFRKSVKLFKNSITRIYKIVWTHLINGKTNSLKVTGKPLLLSSTLLHQPHQKGAPIFPIHRVIIHIFQTHHKLRVG